MKLTTENYKQYICLRNQSLVYGLLLNIIEINTVLENKQLYNQKVYLDSELNKYNELYAIKLENNDNAISLYCNINEIDNIIYALYNFINN